MTQVTAPTENMDRVIKKKKWTPRRILLLVALFLFLTFVIYVWANSGSSKLKVDKNKITMAVIKKDVFQEFIAIDGTVQPIKTVYLDIVEGGRVEKKYMDDGKPVKAGDTILKLSNTTLQIDYINREAQLLGMMNERQNTKINKGQTEVNNLNDLAEIEFQMKQAEMIYLRNEKLIQDSMVSSEEYLQSKNNYEFQQKRYELAQLSLQRNQNLMNERLGLLNQSITRMERNIDLSKSTLSNLYVIAPIDGLLSTLRAEVGESKDAGENIGQIDDLNGFKVRASIDEHYISRIFSGLKAEFDINGKTYALIVKKVYPEVQNGEFEVDLEFDGQVPDGIRRGQTLQIRLQLSDQVQALLVPRGGFYQNTGGNWIFVINDDETVAEKRDIRLGRQNPRYYEILEGLQPNEKVIVSSYANYEEVDELILK